MRWFFDWRRWVDRAGCGFEEERFGGGSGVVLRRGFGSGGIFFRAAHRSDKSGDGENKTTVGRDFYLISKMNFLEFAFNNYCLVCFSTFLGIYLILYLFGGFV